MRRIAFLTYDWNNEVVSEFQQGIYRYTAEHPDTEVHLYDGFGSYGVDTADKGAFQIFNLPYLKKYDGIIIQGNRAWEPQERQKIIDRAYREGIPAVSINYPLERCMNVSSNNVDTMYMVAEHVFSVHGVKSAAFVRGLGKSLEAQDREKGFLKACKDYGMTDYVLLDGSWAQEDGNRAIRKLLEEGDLPEAVLCANDDLAFGAMEELQARGYRIPDDVIVTGFDNLNIAEAAEPRITTVSRNYAGIAYTALDIIETRIVTGVEISDFHCPSELILGTSCGCGSREEEVRDVKAKYMYINRNVKAFYRIHDSIEQNLSHANTLTDIIEIIENMGEMLDCGNVYTVINGLYMDNYENTAAVRHYGDHMYLMGIHDGQVHEADPAHIYEVFSRETVLPESIMEGDRTLQIYPLRYEEIAIGYVVITKMSRMMEFNFLEIIFSLIDSAIENVHKKYVMNSLNKRLSDLYVTDQQTGLYNRFGLQKFGTEVYGRAMAEGREVSISFIDIDDMKGINDRYGHDAGDIAIKATAEIIANAIAGTGGIALRYGGDEFVIMNAGEISQQLSQAYADIMSTDRIHFPYTISHGSFVAKPGMKLSLQEAIDRADDSMYTVKKAKKSRS